MLKIKSKYWLCLFYLFVSIFLSIFWSDLLPGSYSFKGDDFLFAFELPTLIGTTYSFVFLFINHNCKFSIMRFALAFVVLITLTIISSILLTLIFTFTICATDFHIITFYFFIFGVNCILIHLFYDKTFNKKITYNTP